MLDLATDRINRNEVIQNLETYQGVFNSYWDIRKAQEAIRQESIDEQTIIEV
jgi:hypothetical protein